MDLNQGLRQLLAGTLEAPASLYGLGVLPNMLYATATGKGLYPETAADWMQKSKAWRDWATEKAGAETPETLGQELLRVIGGAAVPIPIPAAGMAAKVGMVGPIARGAGNALELATPYTVTPKLLSKETPIRMGANAAVGSGVTALMHTIDQPTVDAAPITANGDSQPTLAAGSPVPALEPATSVVAADAAGDWIVDPAPATDVFGSQAPTPPKPVNEGDTPLSKGALAALGTATALMLGARYLSKTVEKPPLFGGSTPIPEREGMLTRGEALSAAGGDTQYSLASVIERATGDKALAAQMQERAVLEAGMGAQHFGKELLESGVLDLPSLGVPLRTQQPFGAVLRGAERLSPEEQQAIWRAFAARDTLHERSTDAGRQLPRLTNESDEALMAAVAQGQSHPYFARIDAAWKDAQRVVHEFQVRLGLRTQAEVDALRETRPHYTPMREAMSSVERTMLNGERQGSSGNVANPHGMMRNIEEGAGVQNIDDVAGSMARWIESNVASAISNKFQRDAIEAIRSNPGWHGKVREVDGDAFNRFPDRVLRTYKDGKAQYHQLPDNMSAALLKQAPYQVTGGFMKSANFTRSLASSGLAGVLAPFYAAKGFMRDLVTSSLYFERGRKHGLVNAPGDWVSALPWAVMAVPQMLVYKAKNAIIRDIESSLMADRGFWAQNPQVAQLVARNMANTLQSFSQSMDSMYSLGAHGTSLLEDTLSKASGQLTRWQHGMQASGLGGLWNAYKAVIDSIHNAPMRAFFHRNFDPSMSRAATAKLVKEAMEIQGANFSRRGLGYRGPVLLEGNKPTGMLTHAAMGTAEFMATTVPFANAAMVAMQKFVRESKRDKTRMGLGLLTSVGMGALYGAFGINFADQHSGSTAYSDWYKNQPAEWRNQTLYLPIPGARPDQGLQIYLPAELGIFKALSDVFWQFLLYPQQQQEMVPWYKDMMQGLANMLSLPAPPILSIPTALMTGQRAEIGIDARKLAAGMPSGAMPVRLEEIKGTGLTPGGATGSDPKFAGGWLSANMHEAITSALGFIGALGLNMTETAYKTEGGLMKKADAALQQADFEAMKRMPRIGTLWNLPETSYKTNNIEQMYQLKVQSANRIIEWFDKTVMAPGVVSKSYPLPLVGETMQATNPAFQAAMPVLKLMWSNPVIKHLNQQRNAAMMQVDSIDSVLPQTKELAAERAKWIRQRHEITRTLAPMLLQIEEMIGSPLEKLVPN